MPDTFFILARLFWNQIFICDSFNPSSLAKDCRRSSVRYLPRSNSRFNFCSCSGVNAVRGRFSSGFLSFLFIFRERGPEDGLSEYRVQKTQAGYLNWNPVDCGRFSLDFGSTGVLVVKSFLAVPSDVGDNVCCLSDSVCRTREESSDATEMDVKGVDNLDGEHLLWSDP